jgi:hypothetical protein
MRNAVVTVAAAVIVLAAAVGVAGSHSGWLASSRAAGVAGSPAVRPAGGNGPQPTLTGVSCASTTACTAVGGIYYAHEVAPAVLRWYGRAWSVQHAPNPPEHEHAEERHQAEFGGTVLTGISCARPGDCVAVGKRGVDQEGTLAEHWNGKTWRVMPTPLSRTLNSELNAVSCSSPQACTAVGDHLITGSARLVTVVMRWNGRTWALQSTPSSLGEGELFSVSCPAAAACTAIGDLGAVLVTQPAVLAAQWDGRTWTLQPVPAPAGGPGRMHSAACASASSCVAAGVNYAPGAQGEPGAGLQQPASVAWNASTWELELVPCPRGAQHGAYLDGVDCSAATACTAVGSYTPGTEGGPTMAWRWNGTSWTRQDSATPSGDNAQLTSVSCPASRVCVAVGDSGTNARPEHTLAERWDGSAWALTPTP